VSILTHLPITQAFNRNQGSSVNSNRILSAPCTMDGSRSPRATTRAAGGRGGGASLPRRRTVVETRWILNPNRRRLPRGEATLVGVGILFSSSGLRHRPGLYTPGRSRPPPHRYTRYQSSSCTTTRRPRPYPSAEGGRGPHRAISWPGRWGTHGDSSPFPGGLPP
jgi:hypothetical protein